MFTKRVSYFAAFMFAWGSHLCPPPAAYAQTVIVVDGDTLDIDGAKHRLHGIDAPEAGQKCAKRAGGYWRCGRAATDRMVALAAGKRVECEVLGRDDYGRSISVCNVEGVELNRTMVREGYAWAFRKYSKDYIKAEAAAKREQLGIWQADTQTAEEFRAERWAVAAQQAPEGCPIKGNISKNGRIYHAPWSPWYTRTKVSVQKGERWFCSEAEALAAGWRPPYWGR